MSSWEDTRKSLSEDIYAITSKVYEMGKREWGDGEEYVYNVEKFQDDLFTTLVSSLACVPISVIHDKLNSLHSSCNILASGDQYADTDVCYELIRAVNKVVDGEYKNKCKCEIHDIEIM